MQAVWFSASSGLHYDAERDIGDLGALKYIKLHRLDQYGYGSLAFDSGVLFSTYSMLVSTSASDGTARLDQIVEWFGGERFDGLSKFLWTRLFVEQCLLPSESFRTGGI